MAGLEQYSRFHVRPEMRPERATVYIRHTERDDEIQRPFLWPLEFVSQMEMFKLALEPAK